MRRWTASSDRMSVVYYERDGEGDWRAGWTPGDPPQVPFVRASGGMISTAGDYVIFCQMFLNGGEYGGRRYLSEQTVRLMTTPKIRTNPGSDGPAVILRIWVVGIGGGCVSRTAAPTGPMRSWTRTRT